MIDLVKSVPVGTVFLRNPLILRVFRAHIEAGRHQKAWDMALCFAWKYIPTYKVKQLFAIAAHSGVRFSDLHRTPGVYLTRANMQVGPFVGMCLKPIAERLWVLGIGVDDIRLMRFADTLSDSGVDTDIRGAKAVGRERRKANHGSTIAVLESALERDAAAQANHATLNVRGKRNRTRAMGRA